MALVYGHQAEVHGAYGLIVEVLHGGPKEQRGQRQDPGQQPNGAEGCQHGAPGTQLVAGQGVHDGQVAVKTQAGQAEDAGVHVDQNNIAAYLAQSHAKRPVVAQSRVHSPERQGYDESEVSEGQVPDVDVCSPALGLGSPHCEDDHTIARQAQDENQHVEHGDEGVRGLPLREITGSFIVIVIFVSVCIFHSGGFHDAVPKPNQKILNRGKSPVQFPVERI